YPVRATGMYALARLVQRVDDLFSGLGEQILDPLHLGVRRPENPYPHGVPPWCGVRGGDPIVKIPTRSKPASLWLRRAREPVALSRPVMRGRESSVSAPTADVDVGHTSLLLGLPGREAGLWTLRPRLGTEAAALHGAATPPRPSASVALASIDSRPVPPADPFRFAVR